MQAFSLRARCLAVLLVLVGTLAPWTSVPAGAGPAPAPLPGAEPGPASPGGPTLDPRAFLPLLMKGLPTEEGSAGFTQAFTDSRTLKEDAQYLAYLQSKRTSLCPATGIVPAPMSLDQAKANLRSLVIGKVGAGAVAAYQAALDAAPAGERSAYATQALAGKAPHAAALAFLSASEGEPGNPLPLVSAAGLANLLDLPNEALALLDAADALGGQIPSPVNISGRALALNNRAHALQGLRQWAASEELLRQAVAAAPLLAEAKLNLSRALFCQGKEDEAVRMLRAGLKRQPDDEPFDLTQGQDPLIPTLPFPESYRQVPAAIPVFEQIQSEFEARRLARLAESTTIISELYRAGSEYQKFNTATKRRTQDIRTRASNPRAEPQIGPLYDAIYQTYEAAWAVHVQTLSRMVNEPDAAAEGLLEPEYTRVWRATCAQIAREQHPKWLAAITAHDAAIRAYLKPAYRFSTAMAANLSYAPNHRLTYLGAVDMVELEISLPIEDLVNLYFIDINNRDWPLTGDHSSQCWDEGGLPAGSQGPSDYRKPDACPEIFAGSVKVNFEIASMLAVSFNCEKIQCDISTPLLGPFAQVSYRKGGEWTLFGGIKAGLPGTPVSGKTGFFIRGNNAGDITDGGYKTTLGANLGVVTYTPIEYEVGVASAVEYLTSDVYKN